MNQRLTRKEMKRDEFASAVERGVEYAGSHARALLIGLGVVAAVVVLLLVGRVVLAERAESANEALAEAMMVHQAPLDAATPRPEDPNAPTFADSGARRARARELFEEVRDSYGMTDAADVAGLYLAQIATEEQQLDQARELWTEFIEEHPEHILAGTARVNLIHLDRQQGKGEELVTRLKAMLEEENPALPRDMILHELGITLEQLGRKEEAVQSWVRIIEEYPESAFLQEARRKVTTLDPARAAAMGGGIAGLEAGAFPPGP